MSLCGPDRDVCLESLTTLQTGERDTKWGKMTYFTGVSRVMFILYFLFLISCTVPYVGTRQASGVYHRVKRGETLQTIAQAYKVNAQYLAEVNNIDNINLIKAGRVLFIPDAQQVLEDTSPWKRVEAVKSSISKGKQPQKKQLTKKNEDRPLLKGGEERKKSPVTTEGIRPEKYKPKTLQELEPDKLPEQDKAAVSAKEILTPEPDITEEGVLSEEQKKITFDKKRFVWPVQGKVISRFGIQPNGMFMNGIKIAVPEGSQVVAAADGTVIFSAPLKDYGETIILKHDDDFATVYSYIGQGLVKLDEHVKKNDRIGILAKSELKEGGVVHFEVRLKNKARNPSFYLP
ncbi:MAG TPA: M23 family metallopeptidase [Syntrophales bacterium]|nr:M23 family metallopeptidase [Syntrophales bacterium]